MRFGDPLLVWRDGVCVYHVFYLKAKSSPPEELIFAHVSSRDLLHWKENRTCQCAAAQDAPADFYLEAKLRIAPGARALFVLRGKTDTLVEAPVAVLVDPAAETVAFTQRNLWGSCNPLSAAAVAHHDFTSGAEVFVQMILRGEILEVFFDERHSLSMRIDREKGALGLFAREDLAARIVPPPPVGGLCAALEDFLPARKTTVASDRQVFWLAFTANGIPHLLVVLDGDQPAASVQLQGFPADTLIVGDARSFAKNEEGCVLTDVTTHALIKGRRERLGRDAVLSHDFRSFGRVAAGKVFMQLLSMFSRLSVGSLLNSGAVRSYHFRSFGRVAAGKIFTQRSSMSPRLFIGSLPTTLIFGVFAFLSLPARGQDPASQAGQPLAAKNWSLVWSDEFDNPGLPDPAKWDYEVGFVRNGESQYYTKGRPENARVEDGALVIEGRKESFKPEKGPTASYTSASLITRNKASWKYGRIEVCAKLPQGKGVWPAIWMLGTAFGKDADWPMCGEIDILEYVGKEPDTIYATIHYGGSREGHKKDMGQHVASAPFKDFHVYAMEWNTDQIDFFFDGVKYHTIRLDQAGTGENNPFRKPFYLLINLALGGVWGGDIDDSIFPQKYLIDYVRVYQQRAEAVAVAP